MDIFIVIIGASHAHSSRLSSYLGGGQISCPTSILIIGHFLIYSDTKSVGI